MTDPPEEKTLHLDASTRLAVDRTRLALDRTLMAWIRTAISLITLGYGIYKLIEHSSPEGSTRTSVIGHRGFGLIMIGIGLLSLALGTYEHWRGAQELQADYPDPRSRSSYVRVLSGLVAGFGLLAFLAMLLRL